MARKNKPISFSSRRRKVSLNKFLERQVFKDLSIFSEYEKSLQDKNQEVAAVADRIAFLSNELKLREDALMPLARSAEAMANDPISLLLPKKESTSELRQKRYSPPVQQSPYLPLTPTLALSSDN